MNLSFTYFKNLQLMEDAELFEDIITCEIYIYMLFLNNNHIINKILYNSIFVEFKRIFVGEGYGNTSAGFSSSQPPGYV